jgi:hypothetical protein
MLSNLRQLLTFFCLCSLACTSATLAQDAAESNLIGRWDLNVQGAEGSYPSWLEISKSGTKTLIGSYVGQFGSARPVAEVHVDGDKFHFAVPPQWEKREIPVTITGELEGDVLKGTVTGDNGEKLAWSGRRAPRLDHDAPAWGTPIELFNGRDLTGWRARFANLPNGWKVKDGLLVNATPGNDLLTDQKFDDFKLQAEFRYPRGSNSGIYLRGRYELQVEDNRGLDADSHRIGGIYGFLTPRINAAREAGEWQQAEVTLVGRRVSVTLNGELLIDRQLIPGITGGALDSDEGAPGPILLQGDHGPVEFRKLTLTPAKGK